MDDPLAKMCVHVIGPLKYAKAREVAAVLRDIYRENINPNQSQPRDAKGNPRMSTLAVSVYDRTNTLYASCNQALYTEINLLVEQMEGAAKNSPPAKKRLSGLSGEMPKSPKKPGEKSDRPPLEKKASADTPARVTVRLPEDAFLFVNDVFCPLTSSVRTFESPALAANRPFHYILRAEVVRAGHTHSDIRRVTVTAGKESTVDFGDLGSVPKDNRK